MTAAFLAGFLGGLCGALAPVVFTWARRRLVVEAFCRRWRLRGMVRKHRGPPPGWVFERWRAQWVREADGLVVTRNLYDACGSWDRAIRCAERLANQ